MKYFETSNYKNMLNFIKNSKEYEIFIMGHSCGISDRTLLKMLFEHEKCSAIKVFYHKYKKNDGT
jgi:purine-nucleoside phosphorylase